MMITLVVGMGTIFCAECINFFASKFLSTASRMIGSNLYPGFNRPDNARSTAIESFGTKRKEPK